MEVKDYIEKKLVHSLHTSERRSFRSCRRRWNWAHRELWYPRTEAKALEFGVAFHKAMETYYEPSLWAKPDHDVVGQGLALVAFRDKCSEQLKNYKKLNGQPSPEVLDDYKERLELGLNMLKYYTEHISPVFDKGFTPVEVEVPFEVPIVGPNGEGVWCKCNKCWMKYRKHEGIREVTEQWKELNWKGLPVTYGGRLDALVKDELGRYWIVDWKRLTLKSKVATPSGWKTMEEIKVGDFVIDSHGSPTKVLGEKTWEPDTVYQLIFSDGTSVDCSSDHLWKVHNNNSGKSEILSTEQIMKKPNYIGYSIDPIDGPVHFTEVSPNLPLHPYVLGSLIGDGCFTGGTLTYASQSGETVEILKKYATTDVIIKDQRPHGANKWQITGPWRNILKDIGLWGKYASEKSIPKDYLFASVEDRILLLQGLCDTDGNTGMFRWTTTSPQLAKDFCHLVWSLGGTADTTVSKERLHQNGTTINVQQYNVNYTFTTNIEPNQLERKRVGRVVRQRKTRRRIKEVVRTNRQEPMKCIYVDSPDHLFAIENFVLTHNTTSRILDEDAEASFLQLDDQISSYIWALRYYNIEVAGFIYVEIKKTYPKPPDELTRLYKGRKYSTNKQNMTTVEIFRDTVMENDPQAFIDGLYDDHIAWLGVDGPKFHQRHQIHKNDNEIKQIGHDIWLEAQDMTENPRVYPQPGRFSCTTCAFKQPCLGVNMDEDYQYTLQTLFEKRDKPYWDIDEVSTD